MVILLITRCVEAAGAEISVTEVTPFNAPSLALSVKVDPLLSAKAAVKTGFVVVIAPDRAATIVLVVALRIRIAILRPHEMNQANAWLLEELVAAAQAGAPEVTVST